MKWHPIHSIESGSEIVNHELSAEEITVLTRMGERLLGVLIGGVSVFLGYRLFAKLPDKTNSAGKLILPGGVTRNPVRHSTEP